LEEDVSKYLPEVTDSALSDSVVQIDLNALTMEELREALSKHPVKTRLSLTGTIVVARDIAHARMLKRIEDGHGLPDYAKDHIIYYAGPAKTPEGYASGSFGPTTAGRMDGYVDRFMQEGGSFVSLAKGNRSKAVTKACKKYGGFYLGSIGGPAAILAKNCIRKVEVLDNEEDGKFF
jgi:fumarate hydratase class I